MKTKVIVILSLLVLIAYDGNAQRKGNPNTMIKDFLNTEFMVKYQKIQLEMTKLTKQFMAEQEKYQPSDVKKVKAAYELTSGAFNEVLVSIKSDFLDKHTRKLLKHNPELYSSKLELEMQQLKTIYADNFLQAIADAKGEAIDGGPFLFAVTQLAQLTFSLINHLSQVKWQSYRFNDAFLQDRLIQAYSFPSWQRLNSDNH